MDSVSILANEIFDLLGIEDDGKKNQIEQLLRSSSWYQDKRDHAYIYKFYKEQKLVAESELDVWQEKSQSLISNYGKDKQLREIALLKISKLKSFLGYLDRALTRYTETFNMLMNSYNDVKGRAFYLFYFKGKNAKEVATELNLATGTVSNWKVAFQKDIDSVKISLN